MFKQEIKTSTWIIYQSRNLILCLNIKVADGSFWIYQSRNLILCLNKKILKTYKFLIYQSRNLILCLNNIR